MLKSKGSSVEFTEKESLDAVDCQLDGQIVPNEPKKVGKDGCDGWHKDGHRQTIKKQRAV